MRHLLLALAMLVPPAQGWAAVTHVGAAIGSLDPTTGFTVTIPAGTQADDILYLIVTNKGGVDTSPTVVDDDTGGNTWTRIAENTTNYKATLWWKRATTGTASKTITVSGCITSSAGVLTVERGGDTGATPYEFLAVENDDTPQTGFTTSADGAMVHLAVFHGLNDTPTTDPATTSPGALAVRGEHASMGGTDCAAFLAGEAKATAGATGNFTWANGAAATTSMVWATKAAAEGGGGDTRRSRMGTQGVGR